jgi:uncharacterized membrane protein
MTRSLLALAIRCVAPVLVAYLCFGGEAQAQLQLCNRTSYIVYAATAAQDRQGVTTQGWTRIVPGECRSALDELNRNTNYFVYARSSSAHTGPSRAWAGPIRLCALDVSFRLHSPLGTVRCDAEATAMPFAQIQTKGLSEWTMSFTESAALNTAAAARTAGLKRLLRDNGAKIARIDGKPDKQTGDALSAFRKRMKLSPSATTNDMFDALETEALRAGAPAGYSICNDTDGDVWAAIAMPHQRDFTTRGWWKIPAGSCAKAITTPLAVDKIFLHAEKHLNANLVSGPEKFCLTNAQFEVEGRGDCKKRGLSEVGFATTVTKGLAGYAAHIGSQGLVAPLKVGAKK